MRRQELPLRAPDGGRRLGGDVEHAQRLRVPGPEVLGLLQDVRPGVALAQGQGGAGRDPEEPQGMIDSINQSLS